MTGFIKGDGIENRTGVLCWFISCLQIIRNIPYFQLLMKTNTEAAQEYLQRERPFKKIAYISSEEQSKLSKKDQDDRYNILGMRCVYLLIDFLFYFDERTVQERGMVVEEFYEHVFASLIGPLRQQDGSERFGLIMDMIKRGEGELLKRGRLGSQHERLEDVLGGIGKCSSICPSCKQLVYSVFHKVDNMVMTPEKEDCSSAVFPGFVCNLCYYIHPEPNGDISTSWSFFSGDASQILVLPVNRAAISLNTDGKRVVGKSNTPIFFDDSVIVSKLNGDRVKFDLAGTMSHRGLTEGGHVIANLMKNDDTTTVLSDGKQENRLTSEVLSNKVQVETVIMAAYVKSNNQNNVDRLKEAVDLSNTLLSQFTHDGSPNMENVMETSRENVVGSSQLDCGGSSRFMVCYTLI